MTVFGYILAADINHGHSQGHDLQNAGAADLYVDDGDEDLAERPELGAALARLAHGDTLAVTWLGYLAPSGAGVLKVISTVVDKGATLRALHDNIAVTPDDAFHAIVQAFTQAKIDIARLEQELERLAVPPVVPRRSNAGRPKSLTPDQIRHARQSIDNGQENVPSMAKLMKVNKTTLWRALRESRL